MKLETFFEKFDQFADVPDAVGKMRELILQLAVIGKLCPQDSLEEPASALLAKIAGTIKSRYASGEIRLRENARVSEDLKVSVPDGWSSVALGEIADVNWGNTSLTKKSYSESGFTAYSATGPDGWIDHAEFSGPGIVLSAIGARSGKCFLAEGQWTAIKNTITIIPFSPVSNDWLFRAINRESAWKKRGGAQPFIALKDAISLPLLLPPLAEQKRIVAKVDELMALCDRLALQQQEREEQASQLTRASLARFADAPTPANLHFLFHSSFSIPPSDLRKSILTLAVQGKLVPQDPNDEPGEELFERIQAERAEQEAKGAYKSSRPLEPIEENEEPFKLPVEWKWARLRSLVFTLGDGLHGTPDYSDGTDCYFINGNNLVDGRIVIKPHTKTVSLDEAKKHRKPMTLSTVLVSINGTLGSVAFYNNENVILGKSACYFNLASLVDKHFARRVIESPYFVNYASENATGTTIRNLGLKAMNYFPFPLPPLAEQRRIVAKVEQLMAWVDALETQLAASRTTAANLLTALVAELTTAA